VTPNSSPRASRARCVDPISLSKKIPSPSPRKKAKKSPPHRPCVLPVSRPTQDVSTCNNVRPGLRDGNKTGLCAHIFRLLRKTKVPWVLLENVPGLLVSLFYLRVGN
jgi:site-specific DNA-cytosine methylase